MLRLIDAIRWIMTATVPVLPTLILSRQLFASNLYTEFHENPVRNLVAHIGSSKGEQKNGHTEGHGFHRRGCCWVRQ